MFWFVPFAFTVTVAPVCAFAGTSKRSCNATSFPVAGIAAATGCPPPRMVALQPCGTPSTLNASRSGGRP